MEKYRKPWIALRIETKGYCKVKTLCRAGNLAVWYNPETKQHKKVFIKDSEKAEFRILIQEGLESRPTPKYHIPVEDVGKKGFIPRGNITELQEVAISPLQQDLKKVGLGGGIPTRKKGKVVAVYDGNTILVSDGRGVEVVVRIRGLYTEPLRKRGDEEDNPLALRQKETLESFILGQEIELLYDVDNLRDSQQNSLATVYLKGETPRPRTDIFGRKTGEYDVKKLSEIQEPEFNKNVKQLMLNQGMAIAYEDRRELLLEEALKKKDIELQKKLDFVKAQSKLPESERQQQTSDKWGFWDYANTVGYTIGASLKTLENVIWKQKLEVQPIRSKTSVSDVILDENSNYGKTVLLVLRGIFPLFDSLPDGTKKMLIDTYTDPSQLVGTGRGILTKSVTIGTKRVPLTEQGWQIYKSYLTNIDGKVYGQVEAGWKLLGEIRKNPNLVQYEGWRILFTNVKLAEMLPSKLRFSSITAWNVIVKKPISSINNKASSEIAKLTTKLNNLSLAEIALRKFQYAKVTLVGGKQLPHIPTADIVEVQSSFRSLMNEIRLKKQLASLEIDLIADAAKAELGKGFGGKVTDIIETGKFTTGKLRNIVDDINDLHKRMAIAEKSRGLLGETREFYIRHVLTPSARKAMEIEDKVLGLLDIDATFSIGRKIEGKVSDINKAYKSLGATFDLFELDALKALKIRYKESIQATETYDFLNGIKKQYGVNAKYYGELRNTHSFSKIPILKDVLLPNNVIKILEGTIELGQHIKTLSPPNTIFRRGVDAYTGVRRGFQRTVTVWFAAFHSRNVISATAENLWRGVWNPIDYLRIEKSLKGTSDPIHNTVRQLKGGKVAEELAQRHDISFVTVNGDTFTNEKFLEIAREGNILDQPGFIDFSGYKPWQQHSGLAQAVEQANALPAAILKSIENRVRLTLLRQRLILGDTPEQAIRFVNDAHVDYTRQLSELEQVGENIIPFYRWTVANPIIQTKKLVTHPGSFAAIPKATDAWHDEEDKIMLNYKPDYLQGAILVKLPGTEDAFARIPLATEDITMLVNNVRSENHAFYWDEALLNPDIVRRFARYNLDVDWLSRGGGVAEAVGNTIIITYKTTGASIIVQMASDGQTLEFIDGDTGMVLKSFNMDARRGKPEVMADNAPLKKLASRYMYPWFTAPGEIYTGEEWRFGREIDDLASYLFRKFGGSRAEFTVAELNDPTIPKWEKFMELVLGINVYHAADWIDLPEEIADEVIEKEIAAYRGSYSGCGFSY